MGISGYMGSGKNLICKIIQGLSVAKENNIIENANYEWIERFHLNSEWKQKALGKLKQIASLRTWESL